jgi:transcriptional regulator with XRE-family HTH domain
VTDLAVRAGFGKNGRGYISKIEHNQIKRLGEEPLAAIAQALDLSQSDLQKGHMPETRESQVSGKETLDDAITGCKAWLKVYRQDDKLDSARTYLKLAELCWERMKFTERREERSIFLADALQSIDQALPLFREEAPYSYEEAQQLRSMIEREILLKDLDDAIAGCKALLKVSRQQERPLDWARTHARLAQLYRDRATQSEQADERRGWLGKALQSIDQALPLFLGHAPISYSQAQRLRLDVEAARDDGTPGNSPGGPVS